MTNEQRRWAREQLDAIVQEQQEGDRDAVGYEMGRCVYCGRPTHKVDTNGNWRHSTWPCTPREEDKQ